MTVSRLTRGAPSLSAWPAEIEELTRRVVLLELEATFQACDPARASRLRQAARLLTGRLEAMKQSILAAEAAA